MNYNIPEISWIGAEMIIFDDGTILRKVIARGSEEEVDKIVVEKASTTSTISSSIPESFAAKKVVNVYYQSIAVAKKSEIFSQAFWTQN